MKHLENYQTIKILKEVSNFVWYIMFVIVLIFGLLISYALIFQPWIIPILMKLISPTAFRSSGDQSLDLIINIFSVSVVAVQLVIFLFIIYQSKVVFNNMAKDPFDKGIISKLRLIAYAIIGMGIVKGVSYLIFYYSYNELMRNSNPFTGLFRYKIFATGLIVLIVTEVVRLGIDMRENQKLTI